MVSDCVVEDAERYGMLRFRSTRITPVQTGIFTFRQPWFGVSVPEMRFVVVCGTPKEGEKFYALLKVDEVWRPTPK